MSTQPIVPQTQPERQHERLRVAHLNPRAPTPFRLAPDAGRCAAIAAELNISALSKLIFEGEIRAEGGDGWVLTGTLRARVTQPCVVTLKPVKTTINDPVERHYSPHLRAPEGDEIEMPDDRTELLGQFIDLAAAMIEELALSLPEYPRAEAAEMDAAGGGALTAGADADQGQDGATRRPFAGLDKLLGRRESD